MQERTLRKEFEVNELSLRDIAQKYNIGESTVSEYLAEYGISPLKNYISTPHLSTEQHSILIGIVLGSGSLEVVDARLVIEGSIDKMEYIHWKYTKLSPYTRNFKFSVVGQNEIVCSFNTMLHPILEDLRRIFYDRGVKIITNEVADLLTPLSIAVWLMDDGRRNGNAIIFDTHSYTRPELERLQKVLVDKFRIHTVLRAIGYRKGNNQKYYSLQVLKNSMDTLVNVVDPHIIDSMRDTLEI